jgi:hypothetical protein
MVKVIKNTILFAVLSLLSGLTILTALMMSDSSADSPGEMVALKILKYPSLNSPLQAAYAFTPEDVKTIVAAPGDTIRFTGNGSPNSNVDVRVTTTTTIEVSDNRYGISLRDVNIPHSTNAFSITAYPVQSMTVAGESLSSKGVSAVKGIDVQDGRGSLAVNDVPADRYNIMAYGDAAGPTVNVEASASCVLPVDNQGVYGGSVGTAGMPAGVYHVRQDGVLVAIVYLGVPVP